jgi:hypothetical protein
MLRGGGYPLGLIIGLTNSAPESQRDAEHPYAGNNIGDLLMGQLVFWGTSFVLKKCGKGGKV